MSLIQIQELQVATELGRLYVKRWTPARHDQRAPIVLFHDSLGCVELWRDFPERLAGTTGRSVIAYDRLGFGRSDPHPGMLDLGFVSDEADHAFRCLREELGIARFVAFGHSVGGGMAVACAARYAHDCRGLITESAQAFVEDRTIAGILAARQAFAEPAQRERLSKYHGEKAAWVLKAWIDTWLAPAFSDWNLDEALHGVRCPLLVLHGEQDEYGSALHPQRIARLSQGPASMHLLHDCGHVPHREAAYTVLRIVDRWLQTAVDRAPS